MSEQDSRTEQDRTRQDKTRQDKARQNRTGQDASVQSKKQLNAEGDIKKKILKQDQKITKIVLI